MTCLALFVKYGKIFRPPVVLPMYVVGNPYMHGSHARDGQNSIIREKDEFLTLARHRYNLARPGIDITCPVTMPPRKNPPASSLAQSA